ncbi:Signal transduction histidine kinase [Agreia bicolorata]|uniref:histidine kinase n=1 Tax=Agreia bicolorata TaxID=110935 RepID=A0A1T4X9I1_9MICO|nr:sensor histidine kinase [Agreia bicolorata]SKA86223.1 Signal transduction histidine kinase [Agreia bicolorata]
MNRPQPAHDPHSRARDDWRRDDWRRDDWRRDDWGSPHEHPGRAGAFGAQRHHRHGPRSGWRGAYGIGPRGPFLPPQARLWLPVIISLVVQLALATAQLTGSSRTVPPADAAVALLLSVLGPVALIGARRFAGPVVVVVTVVAVADALIGPSVFAAYVAVLFAAALAVVRGAGVWAVASVIAGWATSFVGAGLLGISWEPVPVVLLTAGLVISLGFGSSIRTRRERFAQLRTLQSRRRVDAAQQERVRIARELHDVLAHSLSSINVQAGVGLHLLESQPDKAGEALAAIKATSKQALDEVRSVLGILRGDSDESEAPLVPEADLASLPRLVENMRSDSLAVELDSDLRGAPSASVQLALYRIAQESLTNIVRHSGATSAHVELREAGDDLVLRVSDNGRGVADDLGDVAGKGLLGMRERAELLGGRLEAVALEPHGFAVTATIPRTKERSTPMAGSR